jgi:hypothetical protein
MSGRVQNILAGIIVTVPLLAIIVGAILQKVTGNFVVLLVGGILELLLWAFAFFTNIGRNEELK